MTDAIAQFRTPAEDETHVRLDPDVARVVNDLSGACGLPRRMIINHGLRRLYGVSLPGPDSPPKMTSIGAWAGEEAEAARAFRASFRPKFPVSLHFSLPVLAAASVWATALIVGDVASRHGAQFSPAWLFAAAVALNVFWVGTGLWVAGKIDGK